MYASTRFLSLLLCAIIIAACSPKKVDSLQLYAIPDVKKDCSLCHADRATHGPGALKKPLSVLCLECHKDHSSRAEHKVDIVPKGEVKGLPLTDGKMTCFTCHDTHKNPYGSLLRMDRTSLCLACHPV